jgi:hypothetical protein
MANSSRAVFFSAGDKYFEFLYYNFQCFSKLKFVKIYTSVILYVVSESRFLNITCRSGSRVQVILVVPSVTVAAFIK